MKALILGCGNIGGLYDISNSAFKTYSKSFSKLGINFDVFDPCIEKAEVISNKYNVNLIKEIDHEIFCKYDTFIIATPTKSHFNYLKNLIKYSPKLIVCEKPISTNFRELKILENLYKKYKPRIFVNYQRRYQPQLIKFKKIINKKTKLKPIRNIVITYQNGIHNNGSHALDFISFLLNFKYKDIQNLVARNVYDLKDDDPTSCSNFIWNKISFNLIGITFANFFLFNIDIYFEDEIISIKDGSNIIEYKTIDKNNFLNKKSDNDLKNCMRDSMLEVSKHIKKMYYDNSIDDNFLDSIELSKFIQNHSYKSWKN